MTENQKIQRLKLSISNPLKLIFHPFKSSHVFFFLSTQHIIVRRMRPTCFFLPLKSFHAQISSLTAPAIIANPYTMVHNLSVIDYQCKMWLQDSISLLHREQSFNIIFPLLINLSPVRIHLCFASRTTKAILMKYSHFRFAQKKNQFQ